MTMESLPKGPVGRWEWRTFGTTLEPLAARLGELTNAPVRVSDETYLVALRAPHNAKIRGGVLDIKRLEQVEEHGLEQWKPVFKAGFPLDRADVLAAFEAWQLAPPALRRNAYSESQFEGELLSPRPDVRIVRVAKARRGFEFEGCAAELAAVRVNGAALETFSVEHADPQRVLAALEALGLDSRANVSYPSALKAALAEAPTAA